MAVGSLLSGLSIIKTETNLAHAMAESLGGTYNLHHGFTVGLFTPISIKFNLKKKPSLKKKYHKIISQMNSRCFYANESLEEFFINFYDKIGFNKIPKKPTNYKNLINHLADCALNMKSIESNPVKIKKKDLINLFDEAI